MQATEKPESPVPTDFLSKYLAVTCIDKCRIWRERERERERRLKGNNCALTRIFNFQFDSCHHASVNVVTTRVGVLQVVARTYVTRTPPRTRKIIFPTFVGNWKQLNAVLLLLLLLPSSHLTVLLSSLLSNLPFHGGESRKRSENENN